MENWIKIKRELTNNLKKPFGNSQNPVFNNFDEGLDLFYQIVLLKSNIPTLDGTTKTIIPALQDAYISKRGELNSLNTLANQLEAYLKKIIYIKDEIDYSNNLYKSLAPLMEELGLSNVMTNKGNTKYPILFSESTLPSYRGQDEFVEFLCSAYIIRNQVHNSPDWDLIEVATNLKSIMIVYVYATLQHFSTLKLKINNYLNQKTENYLFSDEKTKILYNFITYGNSTIEIKQQLITSFILHHLSKSDAESITNLSEVCNDGFSTNADFSFFKGLLQRLSHQGRVICLDKKEGIYSLTEIEKKKIKSANEDFNFREQILIIDIKEELNKYDLIDICEEVILKLKELFEKNYNLDISEIYDNSNNNDSVNSCKEFLDYLNIKINDRVKVESLFFSLLLICEQNDFLHRISLGNVFAEISNPSGIQNYIRVAKREIYLDTQIIIYALCVWYKTTDYDNVYYRITKDLLKLKEDNSNVRLYVSTLYINEAAFHLKEALLLIPFEDLNIFKIASSSNVFFRFYLNLKEKDELGENIESFGDFLKEFDLHYDDIYESDYLQIASELIVKFLENLGIETIEIPRLDREPAAEIIKGIIKSKAKPRQETTVNNDAIMLTYLSTKNNHEVEPLFITWDTIFYDARKKYFDKFRGCELWHLFSPGKLLNHISLLEFEVNPESLTKDFYSILYSSDLQSKAENIMDSLTTLLDIDKEDRRKYINKLKEFSKKYVFSGERENDISDQEQNQPIEILISKLTSHYKNRRNVHSFEDLKLIFSEPTYFNQLTDIIQRGLVNLVNYTEIEPIYEEIDSLIVEKKAPKVISTIEIN